MDDTVKRIYELLDNRGMTGKELCERLDIDITTASAWKKNKAKPTTKALIGISSIFSVSLDWLLTGNEYKFHGTPAIVEPLGDGDEDDIHFLGNLGSEKKSRTDLENYLLENFRILPEHEKYRVLGNVEGKAEIFSTGQGHAATLTPQDIKTSQKKNGTKVSGNMVYALNESPNADKVRKIKMKVYAQAASAGLGNYLNDSSDYEFMEFNEDEVPSIADFGILISGNSMEPSIEDGDIVWVEEQIQIESGEIGIFILNNEALCKELLVDYKRRIVQLISLNTKYKPIKLGEHDDLRTVGRVILH